MESDLGCSRIHFDNVTSQKPYPHNNKCGCSKTKVINEMYAFSIKYRYSEIFFRKIIIFIYSVDKALREIKIMDFIGLDTYATVLVFLTPVPDNKMELFSYIVLRLHTPEA